ncbi:MAG: YebC/PmpR family DNA-binding transcriptional regulator [Cellvibrionales bacterium TMED148]|nr:YebC/PmpR family DNA-binding transcriptional regulator [Porticoccaceae bacterium]RPG91433.1 MAG: YebC/PmpR family DNA-binding transcriptional regulator [Cellvibrionales bacterium TMED148]
MAGHSKWANIRHRKAAQDAKRGKIFTKLIRELVVAAKTGGSTVEENPRLRAAVDKALSSNMKRDTIEKAISRGVGAGEGENYHELTYEGYAPGGVAVLVECMTDNRNRTVGEVRHVFSKFGGNLGTDGSVSYLFSRIGQMDFAPDCDEDSLLDAALDAGAQDLETCDDGSFSVVTDFGDFLKVKDALNLAGFMPQSADITMSASIKVTVDLEGAQKLASMIDSLEDLDDVQNVYTNADVPTAVFESLE